MIRFGTGGWRAVIGDGFTRENIRLIAAALARRMKREGNAEEGICAGYDRRFLSREALIWFCEVMAGEGVKVRFVNISCPTPQVMFTVKRLGLPYGAMVTASHNPAIYNGIKLFTRGGRDASEEYTEAIQEEANRIDPASIRSLDFEKALETGMIVKIDPRDVYLDSIMSHHGPGGYGRDQEAPPPGGAGSHVRRQPDGTADHPLYGQMRCGRDQRPA